MDNETETYSAETPFTEFLSDTLSGADAVEGMFSETPPASPSTDAAGSPPVEPTRESSANSTTPDGTTTGTPANGIPADPSQPATPELDPFASAEPLTYTVNGQARTFDGISYVKGVGGVIQDADIQKLQQRLSERDNLLERSQQQYQRTQALDRMMTWTQTNAQGQPEVITGSAALEAQRVTLGRALAELDVVTKALQDPNRLSELLLSDGQGGLVLNQQALHHLADKAELAALNAERMVQSHWKTIATPLDAAPNAGQAQAAAPINTQAVATYYASQLGKGVLTEQDTTFLAGHVDRYIRSATQADVQANPMLQVGEPVVDPAFEAVVQQLADVRSHAAQVAKTAGAVGDENSQKLRAALLPNGKAPQAAPIQQRPPARQPQIQPSHEDVDNHFLKMERAAAAAMR